MPSTSATEAPMRRTACAISTPTGPPPSTSSRRGTSVSAVTSRFVQTPSSSRKPGDGRDHRVRPGRDHDVVRGVGLVADLDAARAGETRGTAQHLDALRLEVRGLGPILVVRHHEVAPLERALRSHASAHGLAGARRVARRLERLAGPKQRLRGDAGPVVALAADELALDDRHPQAAVREMAGAVLPGRPGADDDDVEVVAHAAPKSSSRRRTIRRASRASPGRGRAPRRRSSRRLARRARWSPPTRPCRPGCEP